MGSNSISSLPHSIGNLASLKFLGLGNNQLKTISYTVGDLKFLVFLSIGSNQLTSVPSSLENLVKLEKLYMDNNKLSTFPEFIDKLTSWAENPFESDSDSPSLREISLGYNPFCNETFRKKKRKKMQDKGIRI